MNIQALHGEFLRSAGISTDSRQEVKDRIFFALRGDRFDGNTYVEEAVRGGCRLAVTDREDLAGKPGIIRVASPLETLQELAGYHRHQIRVSVIGITGSNGKTTTKELAAVILSRRYRTLATSGNQNNHIGVPLTLLSLREEEVAVVEMGANHRGEIASLSAIAAPDLGLITNIGKAHLEGFGSVEGVLNAKGELYEYLAAHGGRALIDGSDPVLMDKAERTGVHRIVMGVSHAPGFLAGRGRLQADHDPAGLSPDRQKAGDISQGIGRGLQEMVPVNCRITDQTPSLEVELSVEGSLHRTGTMLVGAYNLKNIQYAFALGYLFGIPADEITEAIGSYIPVNQRSQFIQGNRNRVILDAYNANPTSMREAVGGILAYASSPIMLILGDMAEMGEVAGLEHRELVEWMKTLPVEQILLVGENFSRFAEPSSGLLVFRKKDELVDYLESEKPSGFHVLVKGSRIMALETLQEYL